MQLMREVGDAWEEVVMPEDYLVTPASSQTPRSGAATSLAPAAALAAILRAA